MHTTNGTFINVYHYLTFIRFFVFFFPMKCGWKVFNVQKTFLCSTELNLTTIICLFASRSSFTSSFFIFFVTLHGYVKTMQTDRKTNLFYMIPTHILIVDDLTFFSQWIQEWNSLWIEMRFGPCKINQLINHSSMCQIVSNQHSKNPRENKTFKIFTVKMACCVQKLPNPRGKKLLFFTETQMKEKKRQIVERCSYCETIFAFEYWWAKGQKSHWNTQKQHHDSSHIVYIWVFFIHAPICYFLCDFFHFGHSVTTHWNYGLSSSPLFFGIQGFYYPITIEVWIKWNILQV